MKSSDYWKARMLAVEARGYKIGYEAYKESEQAFKLAERELLRQIEKWIWRIADENEISYAEAKKLLTAGELEEFKWDVNEYIEKGKENGINAAWMHELENASARAHISRLEAMKLQLREYLEEAFNVENTATETALAKIYESEYYHTAYEVQKGIGVGYEIGGINEKAISQAVKKPWAADGKDFSSRIWDNKAKMVGELEQEITRQIITGDSPDAAIEALTEYVKSDVTNAKQKAGTLIMTESAVIGNKAQHDCYKELGVEEFEVVETLDTHTCERCGEMDSKHFPMDQFEIGVTAPPFHPNCRGCTAPYFDDEFQPKKRAARDSVTGKTVQVDNMTYKEWSKEFVVDDTKTVQEYRSVERGETGDFEARCGGENIKISAERVTTYNTPVYVSKKATVKPKALHQINKNTEAAMRLYGIDIEKKPTIVITGDTELGNAAGLYDARSNTVYYAASLKREGLLAETGGEGATEYHEMWHARQAYDYRSTGKEITEENKREYLQALCSRAKKNLDGLGITSDNVGEISDYATVMYNRGRYDETEAEYMALKRKKT